MISSQSQAQNDDSAAGGSPDERDQRIVELEEQVAALTQQVQKLTDLAARAQADLQNAKQRLEKDAEESRKFAAVAFMKRLIPSMDNFQRAFQQLPEDLQSHDWVKGMSAIEQDFLKQMTEMGLQKMDVLGQQVDTNKHEVLSVAPGKEGEILEVFEDGYELHGRVVRPAKVKVGDGTGV